MSVLEFTSGRNRAPMSFPVSWSDHLDLAGSQRAVLAVVRDYVARIDPPDLAKLPPECRPGKFFDAEDVSSFAVDLMRYHFTYANAGARVTLDLIAFFAQAAQRLSEIAGSANDKEHQADTERPSP